MCNNMKNGKGTSVNQNINFTVEQLLDMIDSTPMCINVVNENADSVYCNKYTLDLYKVTSIEEYCDKFYDMTPEKQPNGKNSKLAFAEYVLLAIEKGEIHFNWLDLKRTGEEIPLYISIYRLNHKDDQGRELLLSTMQDLSPQLAGGDEDSAYDEYYHSRVTYKVLFNTIAELTEEWFWIYDVSLSTIQFFGKGREILGLSAEKQPFPDYVVNSNMVYSEDLELFLQFNEALKIGKILPTEVRFIQPTGISKYYRITYKTMYNKYGKPMFSIGKTYDIDKQKRLEVMSKTDLLTNCFNKITTENIIRESINTNTSASHALFLIDVDDFKSVNDELGHYFGDITLTDIAKNLHANFRSGDIIGRIGGDEFLVFVKNISDASVIEGKAKAIARAFENSYSGENKDYKISGSIGVSLYPQHGNTYEALYKSADKALYSSKMAGKDRYTIYSDELENFSTRNLTEVDNSNKLVKSYLDAEITALIFDLMYQSEDVIKSMNTVLRIFGMHLNADRCYISETLDEGKTYSITYEWVIDHKLAKKDLFQDIPTVMLQDTFAELERNGIMFNSYIRDFELESKNALPKCIAGLEPAKSYLLVQTKGKGYSRIVFGVEDSNEHRVWSEKEINTMQYVLKLISIFISSLDVKKKQVVNVQLHPNV